MADLYGAVVLLAALAGAAFWISFLLTGRAQRWFCDLLAIAVILAVFGYARFFWQNPRLAGLLPYASLIVLGNWFLPVMGFLAGIVWRRVPGGALRKSISVVALGVSGGYATLAPLLGRAPDCRDSWEHGVCVQTTNKTCTPACAATLLSWHGIPAREQEMAELCLTRDGTTWQGLYRGLKLKTAGTPWDVQVVQCDSESLKELSGSPLILSVGLERDVSADREYETEWGWTPGVRHSVVLRGFTIYGHAEIADPAPNSTFERWSPETLRVLWRGTAVRLVPRNG